VALFGPYILLEFSLRVGGVSVSTLQCYRLWPTCSFIAEHSAAKLIAVHSAASSNSTELQLNIHPTCIQDDCFDARVLSGDPAILQFCNASTYSNPTHTPRARDHSLLAALLVGSASTPRAREDSLLATQLVCRLPLSDAGRAILSQSLHPVIETTSVFLRTLMICYIVASLCSASEG